MNSTNQVNNFFDKKWQLYQKVVQNNYMEHQEVYGVLHDFLNRFFQKPFKLLDLGCGDASWSVKGLSGTPIEFYLGFDQSEVALEIAKKNVSVLNCESQFFQGNLTQFETEFYPYNGDKKYDAVMAAFSLHHLSPEQKEMLLVQIFNVLNKDGVLILIDVFRKASESRDYYLERYLGRVKQNWSLLTSEEYHLVEEHISSSDFPETEETLKTMAENQGFIKCDRLYQDRIETNHLLVFYKSRTS